MARANVPIHTTSLSSPLDVGAAETAFDATDSIKFKNDGRTRLYLRNAGAGGHVVTVVASGTYHGFVLPNEVHNIAAGKVAILGPYDPSVFNVRSGSDRDYVYVTTDGTKTEVKAYAFR